MSAASVASSPVIGAKLGGSGVLVEVVTVVGDDFAGAVEDGELEVVVGGCDGDVDGVVVVNGVVEVTGRDVLVVVVETLGGVIVVVVELVAGVVVVVSDSSVVVVGATVTVDAGRVVTGGEVVVGVVGSVLPTMEDVGVEVEEDVSAAVVVMVTQGCTGWEGLRWHSC